MIPQSDWQNLYTAAVLETDNSRMRSRIQEAHAAIQARQQELSNDHMGTPEERYAIEDALRLLRVLENERQ